MNRNFLYVAVGALAVISVVLGYQYNQEQQKTGIEITVGNGGVSIDKK